MTRFVILLAAVAMAMWLAGCAPEIAPEGRVALENWSVVVRLRCVLPLLPCRPSVGTVSALPHGERNDLQLTGFPEDQ